MDDLLKVTYGVALRTSKQSQGKLQEGRPQALYLELLQNAKRGQCPQEWLLETGHIKLSIKELYFGTDHLHSLRTTLYCSPKD
jgi:hypothetical protein